MTEFEHLTKLIESAMYWGADTPEKIAERLIDEGAIVPPCKVGDTVYWYNWGGNITEAKVVGCGFTAKIEDGNEYDVRYKDLGKTVFLTREEAEAALEERTNRQNGAT